MNNGRNSKNQRHRIYYCERNQLPPSSFNSMKIIYSTAFAALALLLLSFSHQNTPAFKVEILQDNHVIPVENNVVLLEKKQFQLRITLNHLDGIYFHSSFNPTYFRIKDNQEINGLQTISNFTRVEENFNEDRDMEIDDESISFLFYDRSLNWHRFDKDVQVKGDTVIGTKTIDKIYIESNKKTIPLKKINRRIYLFFIATNNKHGNNPSPKELGRYKVKIRWK